MARPALPCRRDARRVTLLDVPTPAETARSRRLRRRLIPIGAVLTVVALGGTALGGSKYFKVDLFDSYRAGYASVSVGGPSTDGTYDTTACDVAVQAEYPTAVTGGNVWPPQMQAFYYGCTQKRMHLAADPWSVHAYVSSADDD
jgi:hypothetical protein